MVFGALLGKTKLSHYLQHLEQSWTWTPSNSICRLQASKIMIFLVALQFCLEFGCELHTLPFMTWGRKRTLDEIEDHMVSGVVYIYFSPCVLSAIWALQKYIKLVCFSFLWVTFFEVFLKLILSSLTQLLFLLFWFLLDLSPLFSA